MKKDNWYFRWWDRRDKKYCEKHGRKKFLKNASGTFAQMLTMTILVPIMATLALLNGLDYVRSDTVRGICFISTSGLMFVFFILYICILPFHKRRSKRCKEELSEMQKTPDNLS